MKFNTVIMGGGLSGLTCGIALAQAGQKVALVATGQSSLHFASGSLDLLGYDAQGNSVKNPVAAIDQLPEGHPYKKVGDAKALAAWLKALPKPAAIMAATDERAVECLRACRAAKIEVPNQIAILGVGDDMSRSKLLSVPLSSVRPNYAQAGFLAMQELDRLYAMRGRRKYQEIVVPADGVSLRDSTKPALSASHLVKNALAFIEQNADRDLTPQMVTSHLGKSRRLVELRFGEICHKTVRMAIEDCRLAKACPRLRQTDGNVRQVAAELQFKSANALTRIFKRHFGKTITTWLNEDRKRG